MRAIAASLLALACSCRASATVERTMPVANLQTYRTVALRVHTTAFAAQGQAMFLEQDVLANLKKKCGFEGVDRASGAPADLVLDINIVGAGPRRQWLGHLVVDRVRRDAARAHRRHRRSAARHREDQGQVGRYDRQQRPTRARRDRRRRQECRRPAREVRLLGPAHREGRPGARRHRPGPWLRLGHRLGRPTGPTGPDESRRPDAEAANDAGKEKLYAADMQGALALFEKANATLPDPKYVLNICIALGALDQWDNAIAACTKAKSMNPPAALEAKIDNRLASLKQRQ